MAIPFSLTPFEPVSDLVISGRVVRSQTTLTIEYTLTGAVDALEVPSLADSQPSRRDHLWESTCFEVFIGLPGSSRYWEVNAAPKGDWNVYRFDDYRQAMVAEPACKTVASTWQPLTKGYYLTLELPTDRCLTLDQPLELGVSTVLKTDDISHWALTHTGNEPDFHRRDSFRLMV